jgi:LysM repeat protein
VLPTFRFARLLRFVLLICAFSVFGINYAEAEEGLASWHSPGLEGKPAESGVPYDLNDYTAVGRTLPIETELLMTGVDHAVSAPPLNDREPFAARRNTDLSQEAKQALGFTKVSVGEAEDWRLADQDLPQSVASQEIGSSQEAVRQPNLPQEMMQPPGLSQEVARQPESSQGVAQDKANDGVYLVQPGDTLSDIASRFDTTVGNLARSNGIADPNVIYSGQALGLWSSGIEGIDPNFIGRQEDFRLDGYVPDPVFSRSGVTVGTGVDIGQLSVADIEALAVPQELKQKLEPYAGLIRQDAVRFVNNHPLHLTEDEASILDGVITQKTIDELTQRYSAVSGRSFSELPPEVRTAIGDIAYQYGSNLAQRMPNFWSDVTEGRWESVIKKLRDFGDRYPTRRNAEADLLQRAFERGDFRDYIVQPGDTLSKIASQLGTSDEYLAARNGITDPDAIYSGQVLYY